MEKARLFIVPAFLSCVFGFAPHTAADEIRIGRPHTCFHYYPKDLADSGVEGTARLGFTITDRGDTADIKIVQSSGYSKFDAAAADCVRYWRYVPTQQDGHAVSVQWTAKVVFRLAPRYGYTLERIETVIVYPDAPQN